MDTEHTHILHTIKRCWANLIREAVVLKSYWIGMKIFCEIHSMFTELKESMKSGNVDWRKSMKNNFDGKMDDLVRRSDP